MKVSGITSIVTGGASGISEATVRLLVSKGAKVIIGDINNELGQKLESELNKSSKVCKYVHCDVRKINDLEGLFDAAVKEFGPAQVFNNCNLIMFCLTLFYFVFNNAGICKREEDIRSLERISNLIAINLTAVVHGCQLAHKHFKAQLKDHPDRKLCIVNTSSYLAVFYVAVTPVYTTTKAAVKTLTNILAHCEWKNTRINAIAPYFTNFRNPNCKRFPPDLTELGERRGFMQAGHTAERVLRLVESDEINGELMTINMESDEFAAKETILPLLKSNL